MDDVHRHQQVLQRGLDRIRSRTPAQRQAFLVQIGILDKTGRLAQRYRPDVESDAAKNTAP